MLWVLLLLLQDEQLEQLWSAHMRIMEMNHPVFDPHPMLSDSYKVFMMQVKEGPACANCNARMTMHTSKGPNNCCWILQQSN